MKKGNCTSLISFAVTAKLICVFVFAHADCWFSHEAAQIKDKTEVNLHVLIKKGVGHESLKS